MVKIKHFSIRFHFRRIHSVLFRSTYLDFFIFFLFIVLSISFKELKPVLIFGLRIFFRTILLAENSVKDFRCQEFYLLSLA